MLFNLESMNRFQGFPEPPANYCVNLSGGRNPEFFHISKGRMTLNDDGDLGCALRKPNLSYVAGGSHVGWCRYGMFPSQHKVLLDRAVPEAMEVSEEGFPFSRSAKSQSIKFPYSKY